MKSLRALIAACKRHRAEADQAARNWNRVIRELESILTSEHHRVERLVTLRDACKFFRDDSPNPARWIEVIEAMDAVIKSVKRAERNAK